MDGATSTATAWRSRTKRRCTDDEASRSSTRAQEAFRDERPADAERLFRRVLDARPGDVVAEHNLADDPHAARRNGGRRSGTLERTAAARPDDPDYLDNLGLAYAHVDRFDEAHPRRIAAPWRSTNVARARGATSATRCARPAGR